MYGPIHDLHNMCTLGGQNLVVPVRNRENMFKLANIKRTGLHLRMVFRENSILDASLLVGLRN